MMFMCQDYWVISVDTYPPFFYYLLPGNGISNELTGYTIR